MSISSLQKAKKKKQKWTEDEERWDGREYGTWLGHGETEMVQDNKDRRRILIALRRPLELNYRYTTLSHRQTQRKKFTDAMGYGRCQTQV